MYYYGHIMLAARPQHMGLHGVWGAAPVYLLLRVTIEGVWGTAPIIKLIVKCQAW